MVCSETAPGECQGLGSLSLLATSETPGTARAAASISARSWALLAVPCRVTTKEQELTFIRCPPRGRGRRPSAPRTSWTRCASFAGASTGYVPSATLALLPEPGHERQAAVAHPALVQGLLELGLTGELDPAGSASGSLDQGDQIPLLGGRQARLVEVALFALEEPHAPGERDEEATRLGAGDLAVTPVHLERRLLVDVPEGPLQADGVLAAGTRGVLDPPVRQVLDPLVDAALARGVLPEVRGPEPPLPVEVPVRDPGRVEVVHGDGESGGVGHPNLPPSPQVGRALQGSMLARLGEPGDLARRPRILEDLQVARFRVVHVAQRVAAGGPACEDLAEGAAYPGRVDPGGERLAGGHGEARRRVCLRWRF